MSGGTLILTDPFQEIKSNFWNLIKKYEITFVEMNPSMINEILNTPYEKSEITGLNSLEFIGCDSKLLQEDIQMKFMDTYGIKVTNISRLSEIRNINNSNARNRSTDSRTSLMTKLVPLRIFLFFSLITLM